MLSGRFYGLKEKGKGEVAPAPKDVLQSLQRPLLVQVRSRLEESKISEPEFLDILRCAQIAEAQSAISLESIPDKPLSLSLESWDTVTALAEELRAQKTEVAS